MHNWELYDEFGEKVDEGVRDKMFGFYDMQRMLGGWYELTVMNKHKVAVIRKNDGKEKFEKCNPLFANNPLMMDVRGPVLLVAMKLLPPALQAEMTERAEFLAQRIVQALSPVSPEEARAFEEWWGAQ
jgi:hypothetical protein